MTEKQLKVLCAQWQKTLRLQDWDVIIKFERGFDMGDAVGRVYPFNERRVATIKVLAPNDAANDLPVPYDAEYVIVHELLHLHFEPFWRGKKKMEQEQAIDAIARALVATKRANEPTPIEKANRKMEKVWESAHKRKRKVQ